MTLTFPQILAGAVGALLIYCAIVNKTPAEALKSAWSAPAAPTGPYVRPSGTVSGDARSNPYAPGGPGKKAI